MAEKTKVEETKEKVEKPKAEERVKYTLRRNALSDREQHPVTINGKTFLIPVGVPVELPEYVVNFIEDTIEAKNAVYETIRKAKSE